MANGSGVTATLPFGKARQALSSRRCSECNSCRDPDRGRDWIRRLSVRLGRGPPASALPVSGPLSSPVPAAIRSRTVVARFSASVAVWSKPPVFASAFAIASNAAMAEACRCEACDAGSRNDRVNSAQGFQILSANEFFADKPNRDLLFPDEAVRRQCDRGNEHTAQKEKLRAGA